MQISRKASELGFNQNLSFIDRKRYILIMCDAFSNFVVNIQLLYS